MGRISAKETPPASLLFETVTLPFARPVIGHYDRNRTVGVSPQISFGGGTPHESPEILQDEEMP